MVAASVEFAFAALDENSLFVEHLFCLFFFDAACEIFQSKILKIKIFFIELIKAEKKPIFKDLVNHLHKVPVGLDIVSLVYNEEQKPMYPSRVLTNDDKMKEMYVKDLFKGQKILIVMPHDCSLNIDKIYLESSFDEKNDCSVKKAVGFYGIDIKIVQNYDAAIDELTNQTNPVE